MPRSAGVKTAHKLVLAFRVGIIVLSVSSVAAMVYLSKLNAIVRHLAADPLPGSAAVAGLASAFNQYRRLDASRPPVGRDDAALARKSADVERSFQSYEETITRPDDRLQFAELRKLWSAYQRAAPSRDAQASIAEEIDTLLVNMVQWNRAEGESSIQQADAGMRAARVTLLVMLLTALMLGGLAVYFNRAVERPMTALVTTAQAVAAGRLDVRATAEGPPEVATLARELNAMLDARERAESEVRALNADLERRVVQRTAALTSAHHALETEIAEHKRTEEMLRAKNDELKGFAYTASHDLKAPLRGIVGYAHELQRRHATGLSERAGFCLAQIHMAATNLDRLIDDLLLYSRVEADTPTASSFSLPALAQAILEDRSGIIASQSVEVTIDLKIATMYDWERGVAQVLSNLIDNAIKYSRRASPPRIALAADETAEAYRLSVRDNGIGFDMKYHDRIFGLFNRLVRQDEFEGTGAGLAIVKKLVEKRGGRIRAESEPGAGAAFFVELPKHPA